MTSGCLPSNTILAVGSSPATSRKPSLTSPSSTPHCCFHPPLPGPEEQGEGRWRLTRQCSSAWLGWAAWGEPRAAAARGPADNEPAKHRGGPAGDDGLDLPRGQAVAAPGVVVVMDADHIPRLKQPRQDYLCGHEAAGHNGGHRASTWTTPRCKRRVTSTGQSSLNLGGRTTDCKP